MKIAVIGATGLVGKASVKELVKRGHEVIALARNTEKLLTHELVTARSVDVLSADFVKELDNVDAVISAFNAGWDNPNLAVDFTKGYEAILAAAKEAQVPYLLVVGGAGSLYLAPGLQLVDTPDFPSEVYPGANAARKLLSNLQMRRDVNWSFVSPAAMFAVAPVSHEAKGHYRIGQDDVLLTEEGTPADITLADLASALVDDVEKRAHLFQRFTVAN